MYERLGYTRREECRDLEYAQEVIESLRADGHDAQMEIENEKYVVYVKWAEN